MRVAVRARHALAAGPGCRPCVLPMAARLPHRPGLRPARPHAPRGDAASRSRRCTAPVPPADRPLAALAEARACRWCHGPTTPGPRSSAGRPEPCCRCCSAGSRDGTLRRFGAVVRHHEAGLRRQRHDRGSGARGAGRCAAARRWRAQPGVTLAYQRVPRRRLALQPVLHGARPRPRGGAGPDRAGARPQPAPSATRTRRCSAAAASSRPAGATSPMRRPPPAPPDGRDAALRPLAGAAAGAHGPGAGRRPAGLGLDAPCGRQPRPGGCAR